MREKILAGTVGALSAVFLLVVFLSPSLAADRVVAVDEMMPSAMAMLPTSEWNNDLKSRQWMKGNPFDILPASVLRAGLKSMTIR